jgi:hypothetical protein
MQGKIHVKNRDKFHNNYFSYLHLPTQAGNYPDVDHALGRYMVTYMKTYQKKRQMAITRTERRLF